MERVARHDFRDLAPSYDAWYQTPLGVFAHAMERDAVLALADAKPVERAFGVEGSWRACSNATGWRRAHRAPYSADSAHDLPEARARGGRSAETAAPVDWSVHRRPGLETDR